jgi:hypothetical protein
MRILITTLLWGAFFMGYTQECSLLMPDNVQVMGLSQRSVSVDLDEVQTVTLPIVFHIVHTGAAEENNISDAQILSQVDVLNEEFLDSKIQFCLAVRDPEGNPTNGITRYDASWNEEYLYEGVSNSGANSSGWNHEDMMEASGCWNPSEYINYYVVSEINGNNGGNGIQGFAYLGPTGDCRDGVVCMYNVTGNEGAVKPGRELGFTGVHEIGHHLSLYHTFSNNNGCEESNCETQGDQVCDTPPTTSNNQGCYAVDCPDALIENFMDYTPETCRNSFTVGQSERMHEQLQTIRTGLVDNVSCVPVVDYDVTPKTAFYQDTWCTPYQDIWIDVLNQGVLPVDGVAVQLFCNGNEYVEYIYDMQPGTVSVLFEQVYVDGAQQFEVQTISAVDQYQDNDYAWWPISTVPGELMDIVVGTDNWANEVDWVMYDNDGEVVIGDGNYPLGYATYVYEVCVNEGCYTFEATDTNGDGMCSLDFGNDGTCEFGGEGITASVGGNIIFATEQTEYSLFDTTFCFSIGDCPLDFDGNGAVGNGDVLEMMLEYGCQSGCQIDPNNDGIVNVMDLLYMLQYLGDCPLEQDFSIGMLKDVTLAAASSGGIGKDPQIYDMTGRRVRGPVEGLATGVYILKWEGLTKKVFVQ